MEICRADNVADNQIDNKAIGEIEQSCIEDGIEIIFGNETSFEETIGIFGGSGVYINTDVYVLNENIGTFGGSGVSMNTDLYNLIETAGRFGVSGVILITGTF